MCALTKKAKINPGGNSFLSHFLPKEERKEVLVLEAGSSVENRLDRKAKRRDNEGEKAKLC